MFSYYGSKSKIVHLYPPPKFGTIIEPFAGSARYALRYFDRDVVLADKYSVIIDVWRYLQQASEADILGLPELKLGDTLESHTLSDAERKFLGFLVHPGVERPRHTVTQFGTDYIENALRDIAKQLFKIRHWKFINGTYECLANPEATWFIDPPYFLGGNEYVHGNKTLDFASLEAWSKNRNGQVIICENSSASWMPFMTLKKMRGQSKLTTEVWWTNDESEPVQDSLF